MKFFKIIRKFFGRESLAGGSLPSFYVQKNLPPDIEWEGPLNCVRRADGLPAFYYEHDGKVYVQELEDGTKGYVLSPTRFIRDWHAPTYEFWRGEGGLPEDPALDAIIDASPAWEESNREIYFRGDGKPGEGLAGARREAGFWA